MRHIYLIRHGEVAWNSEGAYIGSTDLPLNDTGKQQAELLADRLRTKSISAIYSSDLSRAFETAHIMGTVRGLNVTPNTRLREMNYGEWEGLTEKQIVDSYPESFNQWRINAADAIIPGGESIRQMVERAYSAFIEIVFSHADEDIAVVAHKSVNRAIICMILGIPVSHYRIIGQHNSCVNTMHVRDNNLIVVDTINDRCHLWR